MSQRPTILVLWCFIPQEQDAYLRYLLEFHSQGFPDLKKKILI